MNLKEIYSGKLAVSFEIFPHEDLEKLYCELNILKKFKPALVSLTYGAGGNTRVFSYEILKHLKTKMQFEVMPHFTCICNSRQNVEENLEQIEKLGIQNILALRGDIPENNSICYRDFRYANELTTFISHKTDLSIGVAGYPEGHIESPDLETDIENLKRKVDAGASAIYTQLFFDNQKFYNYTKLVNEKGIKTPIIPGIMPILSIKQIEKMTKLARISIPKNLCEKLDRYKDNQEDIKKFGIEFASSQCSELIAEGIAGLHFFTLNKSYSTSKILENIL